MLDFRVCAALSLLPCVLAIGCSSGGGAGGAGTGTGTTTATSGTSTNATGATTTSTGTTTATSSGTGSSCGIHTTACGTCFSTACMSQLTACSGDAGCKPVLMTPNATDTCICNAQMMGNTTSADACLTTFGATGTTEKALSDCVQSMCKTQCSL